MPKRKKTRLTSRKGLTATGRPTRPVPKPQPKCIKEQMPTKKKVRLTRRKGFTATGRPTKRVPKPRPKCNEEVTIIRVVESETESDSTTTSEPEYHITADYPNINFFSTPKQAESPIALKNDELDIPWKDEPGTESEAIMSSEPEYQIIENHTDLELFDTTIQTAPQMALTNHELDRYGGQQIYHKIQKIYPEIHEIYPKIQKIYPKIQEKVPIPCPNPSRQHIRQCQCQFRRGGKLSCGSFGLDCTNTSNVLFATPLSEPLTVVKEEEKTDKTNETLASFEVSDMSENSVLNRLDSVNIKAEPIDTGTESECVHFSDLIVVAEDEESDIPSLDTKTEIYQLNFVKELAYMNGVNEDSDCEDLIYFGESEVEDTRKCSENTKLIVKDVETQLDWHLQQFVALKYLIQPKKKFKCKEATETELSVSQLSHLLENSAEANHKFITSKKHKKKATLKKKQFSEAESEESEDSKEEDLTDVQKPKQGVYIKEEIVEEMHDLIVPKTEVYSDPETQESDRLVKATRRPTGMKRGRKSKRKYRSGKRQKV